MPSVNQGGSGRKRRTYPDEHHDEAARFLDWDILERRSDRDGRSRMVLERIASIDRLEVVHAWLDVEVDLGRGNDGRPRKKILAALSQRKQTLEEIGERDERTQPRQEPRDLAPVERTWSDRPDVEEASDRATFMQSSRTPSNEVATDGGEQP